LAPVAENRRLYSNIRHGRTRRREKVLLMAAIRAEVTTRPEPEISPFLAFEPSRLALVNGWQRSGMAAPEIRDLTSAAQTGAIAGYD
jgi:hypothetical protein